MTAVRTAARAALSRPLALVAATRALVTGAAAVLVGALGASRPVAALAMLAGSAIVLWPSLGLFLAVTAESTSIPVQLWTEIDTSMIQVVMYGAALCASVVLLASREQVRRRATRMAPWVLALIVWGMASSLGSVPLVQSVTGLGIAVLPLLVYCVAGGLGRRQTEAIYRGVGVVVLLNAVAAVVEWHLGTRALGALGLEYGTAVRTIGSTVRAPGLFGTGYQLGAFAAVFFGLTLARLGSRQTRTALTWVFLAASVACVLLSTSRAGVAVCLVTAMTWAVTSRRSAVGARTWAVFAGGALVAVFAALGLTSASSLVERLSVWSAVLSRTDLLRGSGWGSSGAAGYADGATSRVFVDNYYLSITFQLGMLGVVALALIVRRTLPGLRDVTSLYRAGATATLVGVLAGFLVIEMWEYTSAMCLLCLFLGAEVRNATEPADASPARLSGVHE